MTKELPAKSQLERALERLAEAVPGDPEEARGQFNSAL